MKADYELLLLTGTQVVDISAETSSSTGHINDSLSQINSIMYEVNDSMENEVKLANRLEK